MVDGGGLAVRLRRSKTDRAGTTVIVGITATDPLPDGSPDPLDAVHAWRRWHNQLRAHGLTRGPVWCGIDRYDRRPRAARLQPQAINLIVTRRGRTPRRLRPTLPPTRLRHQRPRRRRVGTRRPTPRPLVLTELHDPLHRRSHPLCRHQPHPQSEWLDVTS